MLLKTIKVFNIMSRTNETRHISQHKTCACKGRLDASVCNNKQHWNIDTRRCQYKELIDKGRCYNGSIQNPIICECECDHHVAQDNIQITKIVKELEKN